MRRQRCRASIPEAGHEVHPVNKIRTTLSMSPSSGRAPSPSSLDVTAHSEMRWKILFSLWLRSDNLFRRDMQNRRERIAPERVNRVVQMNS